MPLSARQMPAWNAAEEAERATVEPTMPAVVLPGPGSSDGPRLGTGVLPPDDSGASQRLRTAPMGDLPANAARRRSSPDTTPPPGRWLRYTLAVMAVILGILWVIAETRPDLITQFVHPKTDQHAVAAEALPLFEEGKKALLRDTDADYDAAIAALGKALQQDAQYAEAHALQVVAHSLRGADLRRVGADQYAAWEQEQAVWRGLKALERQGATLSPEQVKQSHDLEESGPKHLEAATDMLERGGKELSIAQIQAQRARTLWPQSPAIAAAAALCYTQTPTDIAVAQSLLEQYATLTQPEGDARLPRRMFGSCSPKAASTPPNKPPATRRGPP